MVERLQARWIVGFAPGAKHHGPDLQTQLFWLFLMDQGVGQACLDALVAFAAHAARQAAVAFASRAKLVVAQLDLVEVTGPVLGRSVGHRGPGLLFLVLDWNIHDRFPPGAAAFIQIDALNETVHGDGRFLARRDGFHDRGRAGDRVASGEDVGVLGLEGHRIYLDGPPVAQCAGALVGEAGPVGFLADGRDDRVHFDDELAAGNRHGTPSPAVVRRSQFHFQAFHGGNLAAFRYYSDRVGQSHDLDAFFFALHDLLVVGGHLVAAAAIDDERLLASGAKRGANGVHGHVAAADHRHPVTDVDPFSQVDLFEKFQARVDPFVIFALDSQHLALLGADSHEERLVSLLTQLPDGEVLADLHAGLELHAQVLDDLDFGLDDVPGQTVGRYAHREHAAENGKLFENRNSVALDGEKIGGGQSAGPGADDGDFLRALGLFLGREGCYAFSVVVRQVAVQVHDSQRLVHFGAGAGALARVMANTAADPGKRVFLFEKGHGLSVLALVHKRNPALYAHMGGTRGPAGRGPPLFHGEPAGDGLRVFLVDRLSRGQALVVLVGNFHGTDFGAFPAAGAFRKVHKTGTALHGGGKPSGLSVQFD